MNPLLFRYQFINTPVERLSKEQLDALEKFRTKLGEGVYRFEEASCCLCRHQNGELVARRDRYALPVNTYLCKTCGIMWTTPRMTIESLAKFYGQDYRPIYVGHAKASENFFAEQIRKGEKVHGFVKPHIPFGQNWTVFDIGCGAGGMLYPFSIAGCRVFGCDMGEEYLRRGRDAGLVLEHGGAGTLQKYSPANLVILIHVLEHLPDPLENLKRISRLLVDDGYLYVELPGIFSIHKTYGDTLLFLQNAHLYHFTLTTLTALLSRAGYKLIKGDEYIHALFQKDSTAPSISLMDQHRQIRAYLIFAELNRIFRHYSGVRYIRHLLMQTLRWTMGNRLVDIIKRKKGVGK